MPTVGPPVEPDAVVAALAEIRALVGTVDRVWTHDVEIVAVTKGFGPSAIRAAADAGCTVVGENYAQELLTKRAVVEATGVAVSFIGRLQSNKVRQIADLVDLWSSVDRRSLAVEVARRRPGAHVLVQVDTTGDPAKGGCPIADIDDLVDSCRELGLHVEGLMTVGPTGRPANEARAGFRAVRAAVDRRGLAVCSMGMSGDLEIAVQEGSTQLRIGSALFGRRPAR